MTTTTFSFSHYVSSLLAAGGQHSQLLVLSRQSVMTLTARCLPAVGAVCTKSRQEAGSHAACQLMMSVLVLSPHKEEDISTTRAYC